MTRRIAIFLALLPTFAAAQDGPYGNPAGCDRHAGKPPAGEGVVLFYPGDRLEFWESACPIAGALQVGGGATLVTVTCSGEGETWEDYYMLETTSDDGFMLYPEDTPDRRTALAQCP